MHSFQHKMPPTPAYIQWQLEEHNDTQFSIKSEKLFFTFSVQNLTICPLTCAGLIWKIKLHLVWKQILPVVVESKVLQYLECLGLVILHRESCTFEPRVNSTGTCYFWLCQSPQRAPKTRGCGWSPQLWDTYVPLLTVGRAPVQDVEISFPCGFFRPSTSHRSSSQELVWLVWWLTQTVSKGWFRGGDCEPEGGDGRVTC